MHGREGLGVEHLRSLGVGRGQAHHEVGARQQFGQAHLPDVWPVKRARRRHQHLHAKRQGQLAERTANAAQADDAQCGAAQLAAREGLWRLLQVEGLGVPRDATPEVDHRADHPLGHGGVEAGAGPRDEHAMGTGGIYIDGADVHGAA